MGGVVAAADDLSEAVKAAFGGAGLMLPAVIPTTAREIRQNALSKYRLLSFLVGPDARKIKNAAMVLMKNIAPNITAHASWFSKPFTTNHTAATARHSWRQRRPIWKQNESHADRALVGGVGCGCGEDCGAACGGVGAAAGFGVGEAGEGVTASNCFSASSDCLNSSRSVSYSSRFAGSPKTENAS